MTQVLFVTGTDTGVGKTVVSAVLARRARDAGKKVVYVKPVQTGLAPGQRGSDADFVGAAAGVDARELLRFPQPLAPAVAAELSNTSIDVDDLAAQTLACGDASDLLLVEGAGGLLVPLSKDRTMADFAAAIGARLVVAVRPGLGTLNHTALTVEAAACRGLAIECLVVSGYPGRPGLTETTNLQRLRATGLTVEVLGHAEGLSVEEGVGMLPD